MHLKCPFIFFFCPYRFAFDDVVRANFNGISQINCRNRARRTTMADRRRTHDKRFNRSSLIDVFLFVYIISSVLYRRWPYEHGRSKLHGVYHLACCRRALRRTWWYFVNLSRRRIYVYGITTFGSIPPHSNLTTDK